MMIMMVMMTMLMVMIGDDDDDDDDDEDLNCERVVLGWNLNYCSLQPVDCTFSHEHQLA